MTRTPIRRLARLTSLFFTALLGYTSPNCIAESFTATVRLNLIDPSTLNQTQLLEFGSVKNIPNGHCTMEPLSGKLLGTSCSETIANPPKLTINGQKALNMSVNLSDTRSESVYFQPTLYNGFNYLNEFRLSKAVHPILLGGTVRQNSTLIKRDTVLNYDVEIIYP